MEVQPSDEWVLLLSNTLVDTKAKLASSEYERERMKLVIKKLQATLECSEAKRALEIKQELEDSKRELRSTQGVLLGTRQQLQHQKHLVGRLKGQKATMMKALTEKVGDSSGSHSHYTAAGAAAERIVSDPRQYGETTTTLALTKSNDVGSPNRTGMWGAKFLQLSEAGWQPTFFGTARYTVGRSAADRASFWPGGDEDDESDEEDEIQSTGADARRGPHHKDFQKGRTPGRTSNSGTQDRSRRHADLLEINFSPEFYPAAGHGWSVHISEDLPRRQHWRLRQQEEEAERARRKEIAALQYWLKSGGTTHDMPSMLSSRTAYSPTYTADYTASMNAAAAKQVVAESNVRQVFSNTLQDIAASIRSALSTPKTSPEPSPERPAGATLDSNAPWPERPTAAALDPNTRGYQSQPRYGGGSSGGTRHRGAPYRTNLSAEDVTFIKSANGHGAALSTGMPRFPVAPSSFRFTSMKDDGDEAGIGGGDASNVPMPAPPQVPLAKSAAPANSAAPTRYFIALYDYAPSVSSPNMGTGGDADELPLKRGQVVKIMGDIGSDGFYNGELLSGCMAGVRGVIPSNFVQQINSTARPSAGGAQNM